MSELVKFPSKTGPLPDETITVDPHQYNYCQHAAIRLDTHERIVRCAVCNAVLNAFDYLLSNAEHLQRAWRNHSFVLTQVADLNQRVSDLKAEEKRLRARLKPLREKTTPASHIRGNNDQ